MTSADHTRRSSAAECELLSACLAPGFFGQGERVVERKETHISWVFLSESRAYKVKKPVRFEFLDFSTPERRHLACDDEVRLNRRLAGSVYLGVAPISRGGNGTLQFDKPGETVDWVVCMRRLPAEAIFQGRIERDEATPGDCRRIARRLAEFYQSAPTLGISGAEYRARIEAHVRANYSALASSPVPLWATTARRVHAAQLTALFVRRSMFDARVDSGYVVEGHGDLRPEHICLLDTPVMFDCLEFNLDLRTIDTADELCFLSMECERLGAPKIGHAILEEYRAVSGDEPPAVLLDFYQSYRSCVRAKVAVLRAAQQEGVNQAAALAEAERDLAIGQRHAEKLGQPLLVIVRGLSGSGKTTLARAIASALLAEHFETDAVRRAHFGSHPAPAAYDAERYRAEQRNKVYEAMLDAARGQIADGTPVVLDGTFLRAEWRRKAAALAEEFGFMPLAIHCRCPLEIAQARIARRRESERTQSEAQPEMVVQQAAEEEPETPSDSTIEVDATRSVAAQLDHIAAALEKRFAAVDRAPGESAVGFNRK